MKTLGIVGGIGPESTIEYYRFILEGYCARVTEGSAPHLIIDSTVSTVHTHCRSAAMR